jgi:hypothetical protein
MKKVLLILGAVFGVFALLITGVLVLVFNLTSGLPATAEAFFEAARTGDIETARSHLSEEFRASTDAEALQRFLSASALLGYREASWSDRNIHNDRGTLTGSVITDNGGRIPLTISLVKENEAWKIYSIDKQAAGLPAEAVLTMPSLDERTALVRRSVADFARSMEAESMAHFHTTLSSTWQRQMSVDDLDRIYGKLYGVDLELSALDALQPQFDGNPSIDGDGVLLLNGHYPGKPDAMHFEQKYVRDGDGWRLLGFGFEFR